MKANDKQSLMIAGVLHLVGVMALLMFPLIESLLAEEEPVVFELVASGSPNVSPVQEAPAELTSPDPIRINQPDELEDLPSIPELPKPEPITPPQEQPRKISIDEFRKNRPVPERTQRVQPRPRTTVQNIPSIDSDLRERLNQQLSDFTFEGVGDISLADSTELQRYLSKLQSRIQSTFQPSGSGLKAKAGFTISRSGSVLNGRIIDSSGDAVFDQSVLRTLNVVQTPGPPPGDRSYTFSLTFRSE